MENDYFLYLAGIVISAIILRLVFSIGHITRNLQAQTQLLMLIAQKNGATEEEIVRIVGKSNMPKSLDSKSDE